MNKTKTILILFFILITASELLAKSNDSSVVMYVAREQSDTIKENQIIYNGKIWRNLYYMVTGDQFLFSNDFLAGSLTMRGTTFTNISIKYDIFKDELLTAVEPGSILQLNKEMVDSFSLLFQSKLYHFTKINQDSIDIPQGYFNILYNGKTTLYLKYLKKVDKLSVNGENDRFYQFTKLYLLKDRIYYPISGKSDLLNILKDKKDQIKSYIKNNNLSITEKEPESFIPVVRYFDSLSH